MALAREKLDRSVAIDEAVGRESTTLVFQLSQRGQLALADHRPGDALQDFERAMPIAEKLATIRATTRTVLARGRGEAPLTLGRAAEAIPLVERSLELETAGGDPRDVAQSGFLLARVLWTAAPASRRRARELAEGARTTFVKLDLGDDASRVAMWLAAHR